MRENTNNAKSDTIDGRSEKLEQTKLELSTRLEEYKAVRAEIVSTLTSAYQTNTLTFTAVGALIAGSPFILQWNPPYLFVIASFVFYALAWAQLRYLVAVYSMSNHIITKVAPKIRKSLEKVSPDSTQDFGDVITWESQGRKYIHPIGKLLLPIEVARYGIPVLVAATSFLAYVLIVWQRSHKVSAVDWALIIVNVILLVYTVRVGTEIRANLRKNEDQVFQSSISESKTATGQIIPDVSPQIASRSQPKVSSTLPPSSGGN